MARAPSSKGDKGLHASRQRARSAAVSSQIHDAKRHMNRDVQNTARGREGRRGEAPHPMGRARRLCQRASSGEDVRGPSPRSPGC